MKKTNLDKALEQWRKWRVIKINDQTAYSQIEMTEANGEKVNMWIPTEWAIGFNTVRTEIENLKESRAYFRRERDELHARFVKNEKEHSYKTKQMDTDLNKAHQTIEDRNKVISSLNLEIDSLLELIHKQESKFITMRAVAIGSIAATFLLLCIMIIG